VETDSKDIRERITEAFAGLGVRQTVPRQAIARNLISLGKSGTTFSADQLLRRLRRTHPRIGRATVYRSIEKLVQMNLLDRIEFADGTHSFCLGGKKNHRHHLACTKCHRVVDLDCFLGSKEIDAIEKRENFEIDYHSITLFGLCHDCRD